MLSGHRFASEGVEESSMYALSGIRLTNKLRLLLNEHTMAHHALSVVAAKVFEV